LNLSFVFTFKFDPHSLSLEEELPDGPRMPRDPDTGSREYLVLSIGRSLAAGDDRTRVFHPLSWRCGCACDECDDRFLFGEFVLCDPVGGVLLALSADLSDEDALGLGVGGESLDDVDMELPCEGIPAGADAGADADADIDDGRLSTLDCPSPASVVVQLNS
jgi:hypothetical protein